MRAGFLVRLSACEGLPFTTSKDISVDFTINQYTRLPSKQDHSKSKSSIAAYDGLLAADFCPGKVWSKLADHSQTTKCLAKSVTVGLQRQPLSYYKTRDSQLKQRVRLRIGSRSFKVPCGPAVNVNESLSCFWRTLRLLRKLHSSLFQVERANITLFCQTSK
jgi:hypothetical protein